MEQEQIGKFISQIRKEKGLTQQELADLLGVSNKSISRWENGRTLPDISLYEPLCNALDIQLIELLYGKKINHNELDEYNDRMALNVLTTKSQLETFAILTEILIVVEILISMTLTKLLADNLLETFLTLICGWFVWGYAIMLRIKIKKALKMLENLDN